MLYALAAPWMPLAIFGGPQQVAIPTPNGEAWPLRVGRTCSSLAAVSIYVVVSGLHLERQKRRLTMLIIGFRSNELIAFSISCFSDAISFNPLSTTGASI